jgi:small subunit ribosomal protein S10
MVETKKKTVAKVKATTKRVPRVTKAKPDEPQRLRLKVSAYEHKVLDNSVRQIVDTALRYDGKVIGPIPLPTDIRKYTVNRSAFIDKNSREQFEMRVHRRLIDIISPSGKIIEALTNLELPSGVSIDLKMM